MLYAIEGLDASGKSTLIERLQKSGYKVLKTPPDEFKHLRPKFENAPLWDRFMFYLNSVFLASHEASNSEGPVFCDRYVLSTVAAHSTMGLSPKRINEMMPYIHSLEKPSITFFLTCDEEVRMKRLLKRGASENDKRNNKLNGRLLKSYREWAGILGHRFIQIDTTYTGPKGVEEKVLSYINTK